MYIQMLSLKNHFSIAYKSIIALYFIGLVILVLMSQFSYKKQNNETSDSSTGQRITNVHGLI